MRLFLFLVKGIFLVFACVIWLVFGTAFWLSLLARALVVFTSVFLYAMVTGQPTPQLQEELNDVTALWFRGFRVAYDALFGEMTPRIPVRKHHLTLALEILGFFFFWGLVSLTWSGQLHALVSWLSSGRLGYNVETISNIIRIGSLIGVGICLGVLISPAIHGRPKSVSPDETLKDEQAKGATL